MCSASTNGAVPRINAPTWQGWALIGGYALILIASGAFLVQRHHKLFILIAVIGALAVKVIAARHTRGGWKWRWKGEA